ncbi:MAG: WD40 repeat domain-containing protein [Opitutus sp.]|nr:WD40 repeat domain-containing protein [Opitutus sp.]
MGTRTAASVVRVFAVSGFGVQLAGEIQVGEKATEIQFAPVRRELVWKDAAGKRQRNRLAGTAPDGEPAPNDTLPGVRIEGGEVVFRRAAEPHDVLTKHVLLGGWTAMEFSPDRTLVAVSTSHAIANVYERSTQRHLLTLSGHLMSANGLAFTSDGKRLVTVCGGREAAKIWDTTNGQELLNLTGHRSDLDYVHFSDNGNTLLVGSRNGYWQLWHAPSWAEIEATEGARSPN